ncbi:MAG: hypothetical protein Q7T62_16225 [Undibacterium sp.]|nr:hypothetical protein [Undibacterium sp.]
MNKTTQGGAISLYLVAILMMLLTLAALAFFYFMRYGHLPMQDVWQRWSKSGAVISNELKGAGGLSVDGAAFGKVATVDSGIRRCTIKGKVIFSDVECTDSNPSTREVKLYDSKGGEPPKAPAAVKDAPDPDLKLQMIDKLVK